MLSDVDTALKAAWHAWVISCESDPCLVLDCAVSWLESFLQVPVLAGCFWRDHRSARVAASFKECCGS